MASVSNYPEIPESAGVYILTHIPTGMFYIGATKKLRKRFLQHLGDITFSRKGIAGRFGSGEMHKHDFNFQFELTADIWDALDFEKALLRSNVNTPLCVNRSYLQGTLKEYSQETIQKRRNKIVGVSRGESFKDTMRAVRSSPDYKGPIPVRRISIEGKTYPHCAEAARQLGMNVLTLRSRVQRDSATFSDWYYLD